MSKRLAELLLKDKLINETQYKEAEQNHAIRGYVRYLIEKQYISDIKLLQYLGQKFGLPSINLAKFEVKPEVLKLISPDLAKKFNVIPIQSNKGIIVIAIVDPTSVQLDDIKFATKLTVEPVLTNYNAFDAAMSKYYGGIASAAGAAEAYKAKAKKESEDAGDLGGGGVELVEVHDIDSGQTASDAPVIALVNGLLAEGIKRMASDIHIEPYEKRMRVRMRVDGTMLEITEIPLEMKRAVLARMKIMSRMDISETRIPQDGRIKLKSGGRDIDFRVNSMPTLFGEKIVLRMLSKGNLQLDLEKLGFERPQLDTFRKGVNAPNGLVLVTGPTGSGKTTTLYSALMELNKTSDNLSTAEDPVEYNLEGINQVQINKDVGLTFASVLRALLRQDPDSILVGEIRDYETAETAIQAALTGHLVLSTLHTNDAASTITRLMNMGIEPFLVVASVNTIVAQRLLRTVCAKCKVEEPIPKEKLTQLGFSKESAEKIKTYKGKGCQVCGNSGYKGRIAIYEVLDFSPTLKEMVLKGATSAEIKRTAAKEGMKTLRMSALTKMAEGYTSLEEALSNTTEN
ncbi:MAG: type IV-A pilus assembly ATPase PilB [Xanthomonadaceae bacterium]|nr:type IV-A pilus assembly ATPase PilB [Xanthomonadaceae bacterium]